MILVPISLGLMIILFKFRIYEFIYKYNLLVFSWYTDNIDAMKMRNKSHYFFNNIVIIILLMVSS